MIINMEYGASEEQIAHVIAVIEQAGYQPHPIRGTERTIVAAVGSGGNRVQLEALRAAPGVDEVVAITHPFKLVSRQVRPKPSIVYVRGVPVGGDEFIVIAGPCSVESHEQLLTAARAVKQSGARCCAAAPTSPEPLPTISRASAKRLCGCSLEARDEKPVYPSSPR